MSNLKKLHCTDKCKGRQNCMSTCYSCKEKFFVKCFGVDHQYLPRLNAPDSSIRFVCGNCLLKSKRQSLNTSSNVSTHSIVNTHVDGDITPSITTTTTPVDGAISTDINQLNKNIAELLKSMKSLPMPDNSYRSIN